MYTTPAAIRSVLGPEGDPATAAVLDDATLLVSAETAQGEVDAALAVRYDVPFDEGPTPVEVPGIVQGITRDIGAFLATIQYLKGAAPPPMHPVVLRWQRATKLLDRIALGQMELDLANEPEEDVPHEEDPGATVVNPGDIFDAPMFRREELGIRRDGSVGHRWMGEDVPI